ncbi:MAG: hypothetical protein JXR03_18315 [Cyclobacteriaceae bacterium]
MFKIFIEEKVLEYIEGLPAMTQAMCYFDLESIRHSGLTSIPPGDVTFLMHSKFKLRVFVEEHGKKLATGLILYGHYKATNGQLAYYFSECAGFIDNKVISAMWGKQKEKYVLLDQKTLDEKRTQPFVEEADKELLDTIPYGLNWRSIKNRNHQSIASVKAFKAHQDQYGTHITYNSSAADADEIIEDCSDVKATIKRLKKKYDQPYIIVNFIDDRDQLAHAQTRLINFITYSLNGRASGTQLIVVDVPLRNESGELINQKGFLEYYDKAPKSWGNEPVPFSMVIFRPYSKRPDAKYVKYKTLYLNLFEACRDQGSKDARAMDRRFVKNRDTIMHDIWASFYSTSRTYSMPVKKLYGQSEEAVSRTINTLCEDAVVIRLNNPTREQLDFVMNNLPITWGYPYLAIVLADGEDKENALIYQKFKFSSTFQNPEPLSDGTGIRHQVEIGYDYCILDNLPGNQTVNSLYRPNSHVCETIAKSLKKRKDAPSLIGGK